MVKRGRDPKKERNRALSGIIQALETHKEGLGVRELRKASGLKSNETFYKYLPILLSEKSVAFSSVSVGRGKPKKVFKLTKKGVAASLEFRLMGYLEKIRSTCKNNEQFEIDNYAFAYAIYGLPRNLTKEEKKRATTILKEINSALIELDTLRHHVINKEAYALRKRLAKAHLEISQYVARENKENKTIVLDAELRKELDSYIPSSTKKKMILRDDNEFALIATRGPSFIDEYSLRPENHLLDLIQSVERWDYDGIASVIEQLARNKYVDQEAIDRIKKWHKPTDRIADFDWQQITDQLEDILKIREDLKKAKEQLIQSGSFKSVLGLTDERSFVVTKKTIGKKRLGELKKELAGLENA